MAYEHPRQTITSNGIDITGDSISTQVILRENGIASLILQANDDIGESYLATLSIGIEVIDRYSYDDAPDATPFTVFDGWVVALEPSLTKDGKIIRAICFGQGYWLREMRIADTYGMLEGDFNINPDAIGSDKDSSGNASVLDGLWVTPDNFWQYSGTPPYIRYKEDSEGILVEVGDGYFPNPNSLGAFKFALPIQAVNYKLTLCWIALYARLQAPNGVTSVSVKPQYSLDGGLTWHYFTGDPSWSFTSTDSSSKYIKIGPVSEGESGDILDYNTLCNMMLRLSISGYGGTGTTYFYMDWMFVYAQSLGINTNVGFSIREIMCGDEDSSGFSHKLGIVSTYLDKVLNTNIPNGHSPIGTDYIFADEIRLGVMRFPYMDGLTALQDIVKFGNSARYLASLADGIHWCFDNSNPPNLLIAPTTNHSVQGASGKSVDSVWAQVWGKNIMLAQNMITEAFKTEMPTGNLVLIAGKYRYPLNNEWCLRTDGWLYNAPTTLTLTSDVIVGPSAIKTGNYPSIAYEVARRVAIDFTKLVTPNNQAIIHFNIKFDGGGYLALYFGDANSHYAVYDIPYTQNEWSTNDIVISLGDINQSSTQFNYAQSYQSIMGLYVVTQNAFDWAHITSMGIIAGQGGWILDDFCIVGNVVKGAASSADITNPLIGCRTLSIKDSIAGTDSLDASDITSPLAQLALFELLRHKVKRTTGKIQVPMDFCLDFVNHKYLMGGTQVIVISDRYPNGKPFRITNIIYNFAKTGAICELSLTDDLLSSVTVDSNSQDQYSIIKRSTDPSYFLHRSEGSFMLQGGDFDPYLIPLIWDYFPVTGDPRPFGIGTIVYIDFSITSNAPPPAITFVTRGNSYPSQIRTTVNTVGGAINPAQTINLVVTGQPAGMTTTITPSSFVFAFASTESILDVWATNDVPTGIYTLTITGTSNGFTHSTQVKIQVI